MSQQNQSQLIPSVLQSQVLAKLTEIHQAIQWEEYTQALEAGRSIIDTVFYGMDEFEADIKDIEEFYVELDNVRGLPGRIQVPTLAETRREAFYKKRGRELALRIRKKITHRLGENGWLSFDASYYGKMFTPASEMPTTNQPPQQQYYPKRLPSDLQ